MKKIVKNIVTIIMIIFVIIASLLFSYVVGKKNSNTKEYSDNIKVAIVNNDQGASVSDKTVYYGREFLKTIDEKGYEFTTLSNAKNGLNKGDYTGYIVIPENFSRDVTTLSSTKNKTILIYDIEQNNPKVIRGSLEKINEVINLLDRSVTGMHVNEVLSNVNSAQNSATNIIDSLNANTIAINGISPTNWFKPLSLVQAQAFSASDENVRASLNSLGLIEGSLNDQLINDFSNNNKAYDKLQLGYDKLVNLIDQSKYFIYEIQSLNLIDDYILKAEDDTAIRIYVAKDSPSIYVGVNQQQLLAYKDQNNKYLIQGIDPQEKQFVGIDINQINSQLHQLIQKSNKITLEIYGSTFNIYGYQPKIIEINGKITITNCNKVEVNGQVYYPNNNNVFEVQFTNNDKIKNAYLLSSVEILDLLKHECANNPSIALNDAIAKIEANKTPLLSSNLDTIEKYPTVREFINNVKNDSIVEGVIQNVDNQAGINYNQDISRKMEIITSGPERVQDTLHTSNNIVIDEKTAINMNIISEHLSITKDNFDRFGQNVINTINYSSVANSKQDISVVVDAYIKDCQQQIKGNDDILKLNMDLIQEYERNLSDAANSNVEGSKQLISQNNENSISLLKGLADSLNYLKVGNTIDPKAIEFIVSSVDSNVANDKTNKEVVEEKSNHTMIYVIGSVLLVCATGGLVYVIYNQNKSLKGGD